MDLENEHMVPVIIKKQKGDKEEWIYSETHVKTLKRKCITKFTRKSERLSVIRKVIDLYIERELGVTSIHASLICLFQSKMFTLEFEAADGMNAKQIGMKRLRAFSYLPEIRIIPDHEFLMHQLNDITNQKEGRN